MSRQKEMKEKHVAGVGENEMWGRNVVVRLWNVDFKLIARASERASMHHQRRSLLFWYFKRHPVSGQ
jgi:hypothetical protein